MIAGRSHGSKALTMWVVQSLPESLLTASQRQLSSEVDESHWYDYNSSCAYSECLLLSQRDTVVEN